MALVVPNWAPIAVVGLAAAWALTTDSAPRPAARPTRRGRRRRVRAARSRSAPRRSQENDLEALAARISAGAAAPSELRDLMARGILRIA